MGRHNNSHGHGSKPAVKASGGWTHIGHGILALDSNPNTQIKMVGGHRGKYVSIGREAKAYMERQAQEQAVMTAPAPTETA